MINPLVLIGMGGLGLLCLAGYWVLDTYRLRVRF